MSPAWVVAYARAGRIGVDLPSVPLGHDAQGRPVLLRDIWPAPEAIAAALAEMPRQRGRSAPYTPARWNSLPVQPGPQFAWQDGSTFLCPPPFFERQASALGALAGARPLLVLGDDITTARKSNSLNS